MTNGDKPEIGAGNVVIVLGDEELVLRPTYAAAKAISGRYGGIAAAIDRVIKMDMDAVTDIIVLGLGYSAGNRPPKDLPERIWRAGLTDDTGGMAERCVTYLRVLIGGGRPPREQQEAPQDTVDPQ